MRQDEVAIAIHNELAPFIRSPDVAGIVQSYYDPTRDLYSGRMAYISHRRGILAALAVLIPTIISLMVVLSVYGDTRLGFTYITALLTVVFTVLVLLILTIRGFMILCAKSLDISDDFICGLTGLIFIALVLSIVTIIASATTRQPISFLVCVAYIPFITDVLGLIGFGLYWLVYKN